MLPLINSAGTYSGGDGSSSDPYQLGTLADLSELCQTSGDWDKHFILIADIDASQTQYWDDTDDNTDGDLYNDPFDATSDDNNEGFSPIGNVTNAFEGYFNGDGYVIDGLTINRSTTLYIGLFGYVNDVTIENLGLTNLNILGEKYVGGLAGSSSNVIFNNCYTEGQVRGTSRYVGGLVGAHSNSGSPGNGELTNCYSTCNVTGGHDEVGGLVGWNCYNALIKNCYATGNVYSSGEKVGGLVGLNWDDSDINFCFATGTVKGDDRVGGLVGDNNQDGCRITNSYSTGNVHQIAEGTYDQLFGGFCGNNYNSHIYYCYSTGSVYNDHDEIGHFTDKGFLGDASGSFFYLSDNFFDATVSNQDTEGQSGSATAKSHAEMQSVSTFTDLTTTGLDNAWDFVGNPNDDIENENIWDINEGSSYPYLAWQETEKTWTGAVSSAWQNRDNWSGGMGAPTASINVIIPDVANDPVIAPDIHASCKDIDISASASLTIESDASGSGSLIAESLSDGQVTVQRYLTDDCWHFVSPPTTNATAADFNWEGSPASWLTQYDETNAADPWSYILDGSQNLQVGKGYSVWVDNTLKANVVSEMTGALQTTDLDVALTNDVNGFNLIGNPFSSALDWDYVEPGITTGAVYVWDNDFDADGEYLTWNGETGDLIDGIIPLGQAFFVKAESAGTLTIPSDARIHDNQDFYKNNAQIETSYLKLMLNHESFINNLFISFSNEGSEYFDVPGDVHKLISGNSSPQLFTKENNIELSTNKRALVDENGQAIPVFLSQVIAGQYTIKLEECMNLEDVEIILEDKKTNIFHDFTIDKPYNFLAYPEDQTDRFIVHVNKKTFSVVEGYGETSDIDVYATDKSLIILSHGQLALETGFVFIYNNLGQIIDEQHIKPGNQFSIQLNCSGHFIIVKVVKPSGTLSKKVILPRRN